MLTKKCKAAKNHISFSNDMISQFSELWEIVLPLSKFLICSLECFVCILKNILLFGRDSGKGVCFWFLFFRIYYPKQIYTTPLSRSSVKIVFPFLHKLCLNEDWLVKVDWSIIRGLTAKVNCHTRAYLKVE